MVITIVALAIGIGSTSAICGIADAILRGRLPYRDADSLMLVSLFFPKIQAKMVPTAEFLTWRQQATTVAEMAAFGVDTLNLSGTENPERVEAGAVTSNFLHILGIVPALGRDIGSDEDRPAGSCGVILNHQFWSTKFVKSKRIIGASIKLDGADCIVLGVLPSQFRFPSDRQVDLLRALQLPSSPDWGARNMRAVQVLARRKRNVSAEDVRAELTLISTQVNAIVPPAFAQVRAGLSVEAIPLRRRLEGGIRPLLFVLMAAALFVLLMACANAINLQLARASERQTELGLRLTLGAKPLRLAQQLITESIVLSMIAGTAGLVVAWGILRYLQLLLPSGIPFSLSIVPTISLTILTVVIALCAGIGCAVPLMLSATRHGLATVLKQGAATSTPTRYRRLFRSVQVSMQVAVAMTFLIGFGLLAQSLIRLSHVDPGFDTDRLLTLRISLPSRFYSTPQRQTRFFNDLINDLRTKPFVESVAMVSSLPFTDYAFSAPVSIDTVGAPAFGPANPIPVLSIAPEYFHAMRIKLLAGRFFDSHDDSAVPDVAIVNKTFAARAFGQRNPIGMHVTISGFPPALIIGVASDTLHTGIDQQVSPEVYRPYAQNPVPSMAVIVRTSGDPLQIVQTIRDQVRMLDSNQPIYDVATMDDVLRQLLMTRRIITSILGVCVILALVLVSTGVYGVVSYAVKSRRAEFGIRMACGASMSDIRRIVVSEGVRIALAGIGVGYGGSVVLATLLRSFLFRTHVSDPLTTAAVGIALASIVMIAAYLPTAHLFDVTPMSVLREQ